MSVVHCLTFLCNRTPRYSVAQAARLLGVEEESLEQSLGQLNYVIRGEAVKVMS